MKTLEDIKQERASEMDYSDWEEFIYSADDPDIVDVEFDEVANRFAREVAREALRNASENAIMKFHCGHFKTDTPTQYHQQGADNIQIDKQSILNKKNIPEI